MPSILHTPRVRSRGRVSTILLLAVLAGCGPAESSAMGPGGGGGSNGGSNGSGGGGGTSGAVVSGRVTDPQGRPIAGATVGVNNTVWFDHNIVLRSGTDGTYRYEMPATDSWYVRGTTTVTHHGTSYTIDLKPDYPGAFAGAQGHVVNLQLVMSGEVPHDFGHDGFYGGSVEVDAGWDLPDLAGVSVTLTPVGTLLEGSVGQSITRSVEGSVGSFAIRDVAIGRYAIRVLRHGAPLVLRMRNTSSYVSDVVADFEPAYTGATAYGIYFILATTKW